MGLLAIRTAKFVAVLLVCTMAATAGWESLVKNHLYNCTDDLPLDYLQPGQWVHHPVSVANVVGGRSMSEPDTLRTGWSITGLWCLWFSVVGISVTASAWLAWIPWIRERQTGGAL